MADANIKITADTSQAQSAVKDLDKALNGLVTVGANVSKALLGVTAAAAGIGYAVKGILDSAAALFDAADTIGISVQSLQVFQKAAGEVGVSAEELNNSLMKMNANIGEALIKGSGGAADALKRMGISLDQINGMKPDAQFELIAKRLSEIPNQAERSALAMDVFGKQGQKVLKIAEGLDEMRKKMEALGMLITPEQQASLDLAGDAVDGLIGMFSTGLKKAVADMAPYILAIAYSIEDAVKAAGGLENIIAKVGAVLRYAFNVAVLYAMVNGFIAMQTAIRAAGSAMAVFNLIVQRSPLFLLVAAAAALAQAFGLDVAGAIGKALDASGNLGKANDKIAETAGEIKDKNNEAAVAAKRGNAEAEKAAANALKALDQTIKKMESENQFMKDKVGLSLQEAAVQKIIRDEQDKLAAAGAKMSAAQLARLTAAAQESQELKAQESITKAMTDLNDEILALSVKEGVERDQIVASRKMELDIGRALTAVEKESLNNKIAQRDVMKQIQDRASKVSDAVTGLFNIGDNVKAFIEKEAELVKAQANANKAMELASKDTNNEILQDAAKTAEHQASMLEFGLNGYVQKTAKALNDANRLQIEYNKARSEIEFFQRQLLKQGFDEQAALYKGLEEQLLTLKQDYEQRKLDATLQRIQRELQAEQGLFAAKLSMADQEELQKAGQSERQKAIAADRIAFEKKSEMEKAGFAIDQAAQMFSALGAQNKSAFEAAKAFNIANAVMNTYMAATKALATYPPPFSFIAAGAAVAMGLAQVAQIRSQQYSGRALGGPVMGNTPYLVGENGPEIFTPATTGSITRNSDIGGSQQTTVNFNISTVDAAGFDRLLYTRRGMITEIIRDAQLDKGKRI